MAERKGAKHERRQCGRDRGLEHGPFRQVLPLQAPADGGLGAYSERWLARDPYPPGARVLDVGCGFGDTTVQLARTLGNGMAVGVDCAPNFIDAARGHACEHGADNAEFLVADVQIDDLGGPYDYAFSRFGTMFFNLPGAARRCATYGGR
ncbi:MAG: class I SAM-dependent methyltransferase [Myxococcales bacterium]